ncbi:50S ribosomal protein L4 [Candidatus Woesearchaeota archaeon]|nr:50S ribosomal protein L4 [Candidatus Woesearchaeota archaeon]
MKLDIVDSSKKKVGEIELPVQFGEEIRPDLILRGVLSMQSKTRQPYGAMEDAGMRQSAKLSRRRRDYRGSYGFGISRVPRKIFSRQGRRMNWQAAVAPGTVGGRKAHPPKGYKILGKKINVQEGRKAMRSAIAASINAGLAKERGHHVPEGYPFILDTSFENIDRTKNVKEALDRLGFSMELERSAERKVRAGKGKFRNRKYRTKKGPLIIVSKDSRIIKAANNIPGIDAVDVKKLNIGLLAPGAAPGRVALWTKDALAVLEKERLFA